MSRFPELYQHFEETGYLVMASSLVLQWFITMFAYSFNFDVLVRLWDLVLIKGSKILFRISLAIFHIMQEDLLQCEDIQKLNRKMDSISRFLQDASFVLQVANMPQYKIKEDEIERWRAQLKTSLVDDMKKFKSKQNERFIAFDFATAALTSGEGSDHRIKRVPDFEVGQFLNHFNLYKGIQ